jgi:hypothetical protein
MGVQGQAAAPSAASSGFVCVSEPSGRSSIAARLTVASAHRGDDFAVPASRSATTRVPGPALPPGPGSTVTSRASHAARVAAFVSEQKPRAALPLIVA